MELKLILNFMFKKGLQDSAVTKFRSLKKKEVKTNKFKATKYKHQIQIKEPFSSRTETL
mgnify:CR=1 FL=1